MAVTLFRPELDVWEPGEHNGTFRGNNAAFVTAAASMSFWEEDLEAEVDAKAELVERHLLAVAGAHDEVGAETRGRGLAQGVAFADPSLAGRVCAEAFAAGLLVETSGPEGEVVKLMPPLTIGRDDLEVGLEILATAVDEVVARVAVASGGEGS
jgi:diaminobutyrate-2-oxoglutarate transaminase